MASAEMSTWGQRPGLPTVWPRAFHFTFPGCGRLSAGARCTEPWKPASCNHLLAPAALPTSEMAWENRFVMVGQNGPAPYLIRNQAVPYRMPLTRPLLFAIAVDFVFLMYRGVMTSRRVYRHVS